MLLSNLRGKEIKLARVATTGALMVRHDEQNRAPATFPVNLLYTELDRISSLTWAGSSVVVTPALHPRVGEKIVVIAYLTRAREVRGSNPLRSTEKNP
jgi:hypothetical protein